MIFAIESRAEDLDRPRRARNIADDEWSLEHRTFYDNKGDAIKTLVDTELTSNPPWTCRVVSYLRGFPMTGAEGNSPEHRNSEEG